MTVKQAGSLLELAKYQIDLIIFHDALMNKIPLEIDRSEWGIQLICQFVPEFKTTFSCYELKFKIHIRYSLFLFSSVRYLENHWIENLTFKITRFNQVVAPLEI